MNNIVKLGYATRELNSQNFSRSFKIMEEIFDDFILSTQTNTKEFGFDKRLYKSFLDRCLENNLIAKTREEKNHYYFKITDEGIKSYLDYLCLKSSATSISHEKIQQVVDILSERVAPVSNDGFGSFNSQEWTSESETGRFLEVSNLDFFNLNYSDLKNEISKNLSPSYERERFNLG
jgi:predicted transcriptional regulator